MAALSNKAVAVLNMLRCSDRPLRGKDVAARLSRQLVCPDCQGSGEPCSGDAGRSPAWDAQRREPGCSRCYGRGHLYFDYGTAMNQLKRLQKAGLAERVAVYDEWGDATGIAWRAKPVEADDPLEQAFNLPVVER